MEETVVYLIRHSEAMALNNYLIDEEEQVINEKRPLSVRGEEIAKQVSNWDELKEIDYLYTSNYVRAISSAKYIAFNNDIEINYDKRLGERLVGSKGNMGISDFEKMQGKDFDYKFYGGESLNEVNKRMSTFLKEILNKYKGKKIAIVTHGTSMVSLFINWCEVGYNFDGRLILDFMGQNIYDGDIEPMQVYKLCFNELKLLSIEKLKRN